MSLHTLAVVAVAIGLLLVVWNLGDKKQAQRPGRTTTRRQYKQLPRPRRK